MHTQKDLVTNSTHIWARGERKASRGLWVNSLFFFPLCKHCFTVRFSQHWTDTIGFWSDRCVLCCHYSRPQAPKLSCHWLSHLVKTQACEAEGMSWSPDQKKPFSQICALTALRLSARDLHGEEGRCGKLDSLRQIHYHCWFETSHLNFGSKGFGFSVWCFPNVG